MKRKKTYMDMFYIKLYIFYMFIFYMFLYKTFFLGLYWNYILLSITKIFIEITFLFSFSYIYN